MNKNQILGIGIDIEDINRFKKLKLTKDNNFLNKVFTTNELNYCFSKKNTASSLATKYAGKEAIIKACSSFNQNFDYKEIEITNAFSGAPQVKLGWDKTQKYQIMLSLSNELDKTVAVAIALSNE